MEFSKCFMCLTTDYMRFFLNKKAADKFEEDTDIIIVGVSGRAAVQYCFNQEYKSKRIIEE